MQRHLDNNSTESSGGETIDTGMSPGTTCDLAAKLENLIFTSPGISLLICDRFIAADGKTT